MPIACEALPSRWNHWLACGFGSGLVKPFPGTIASVFFLILWWWVLRPLPPTTAALLLLPVSLVGVWLCGTTARDWGVKDPPSVVWDEYAGLWAALLPAQAHSSLALAIAIFVLFRILDISKPPLVRKMETIPHPGWAIMLDDIVAGLVVAAMVTALLAL